MRGRPGECADYALHFSDEHFRAYVLTLDDGDGELTFEEIRDIRTIDVTDADIAELDGIEYFTALEELFCGHNRLTVLNLFHNTALKHLDCQFNELIAMGVSDTALTELNCSNNFLGSLELSSNTALTVLDCSANRITGVDLSNNTALTELNCSFNEMMWLDVSSNAALTELICGANQLRELDLSNNTALVKTDCSFNELTALNLGQNAMLRELFCDANPLTALDVSGCARLNKLVMENQPAEEDDNNSWSDGDSYLYADKTISIITTENTSDAP